MAYTLQQLSDFEEIRTLKHRYFRAIDTANAELLSGLFTDDVEIDYRGGNYRVRLSGRENMLEFLANAFHEGLVAMHHGHMPEIKLTGENSAEGIWYLEDIVIKLSSRDHSLPDPARRGAQRTYNPCRLVTDLKEETDENVNGSSG